MKRERYQAVIKDAGSEQFQLMEFQEFNERPVNYHKEMLYDIPIAGQNLPSNQDITKRVEAALAERIGKLKKQHEAELQKKFADGVAEGRSSAGAETKEAIDLLTQCAKILEAEKNELATRYEQQVVKLAFELAERILGHELADRPQSVNDVAREAVRQVLDCNKITIRANPEDIQHLQLLQKDIESLLSSEAKFELRPDATVTRGGCMVDTEKGTLDARIASQLDMLSAHLSGQTDH